MSSVVTQLIKIPVALCCQDVWENSKFKIYRRVAENAEKKKARKQRQLLQSGVGAPCGFGFFSLQQVAEVPLPGYSVLIFWISTAFLFVHGTQIPFVCP